MEKRKTTTITFDVDKNESGRHQSREITFDSLKRPLDDSEFDENENIIRRLIFRYSESGEIKEQIEYDSFNLLIERQEFLENAEGGIIKTIIEYGNGSKVIKEYTFSDVGLADKSYIKNENNEFIGEEVFIFDDNDNVICEIETDWNGNEILKIIKQYSDSGNIIEERKYIDGQLEEILELKYNSNNLLVEKNKKYSNEKLLEHETIKYNEKNKEVEKAIKNFRDNYESVEEFSYDDIGNVILNTLIRNGRLEFKNSCCYDNNSELISEELMEIDWHGNILRHEKLIHEFIK